MGQSPTSAPEPSHIGTMEVLSDKVKELCRQVMECCRVHVDC